MKKVPVLFLVLFIGLISISANKNDLIMGKWIIVKMTGHGRSEKMNPDSPQKWIHFKEDNIVLSGTGEKSDRKRGNWVYEDNIKKLFIHTQRKKIEFDVLKLTKKKLILVMSKKKKKTKIHFEKTHRSNTQRKSSTRKGKR